MKLDLGGTACYVDEGAVSISLDGSNSDDEVTPIVIGDYRRSPFASDTFDEALGSCVLEEDSEEYLDIFREIYRILKPGAQLKVKGCGGPHKNHLLQAIEAGFELIEMATIYIEEYGEISYDSPYVFRKAL